MSVQLRQAEKLHDARASADLKHRIELAKLDLASLEAANKQRMHHIHKMQFLRAKADETESAMLYPEDAVPAGIETDGRHWHIKSIGHGEVKLSGGGAVVGNIPAGLASVFNGLFVAVVLLFLTPYLYHLPKAVLAVTGLVTPQAIKHTWKASRVDGMVVLVTFVVTLVAAPHLDKGINDIDASGEEVIHHLVERLNQNGVVMIFSGLKKQVIDVMKATGLWQVIGEQRFFSTAELALEKIYSRAEYAGEDDPLRPQPHIATPASITSHG